MEELKLELKGQGHDLWIAPSAEITGRIRMRDDAGPCTVRIGDGVTGKWNITVSGGATVVIGEDTTCETTQIVAQRSAVVQSMQKSS